MTNKDISLVLVEMINEGRAHLQFVPLDEFVVLVYAPSGLVFHLFSDILEETGPTWCRTQLRDIVCSHLNTLVRSHQKTAPRDMVDVVQVVCRCNRCKVCRWLRE